MPSGIRATRRDERRDRGRGGGDAGRDGEARRGLVLPPLREALKQPVAPLGEVDRAPARQASAASAR